jgi:GMP synthase (glutamine-hydrolysing)
MDPTIAVLDASLGDTPAESNLRRELDGSVTVFKVSAGEFPPAVTTRDWGYDGVVISGSQTSVYDDRDWIHELTEWARRVHRANTPMLGVCWGHQFLAQALGGRVVDMQEHELGYRQLRLVGSDPLFEGISTTVTSFETHHDRVAELPTGATLLARNDTGIQAFRSGSTWGIQFHPEYDRQTAEWVIDGKELPEKQRETLLETITDETVSAANESKRVFENFTHIINTHQATVGGNR